jgi:hypothetical protein
MHSQEECDQYGFKSTPVSLVLSLFSSTSGGIAADLQSFIRAGKSIACTYLPFPFFLSFFTRALLPMLVSFSILLYF